MPKFKVPARANRSATGRIRALNSSVIAAAGLIDEKDQLIAEHKLAVAILLHRLGGKATVSAEEIAAGTHLCVSVQRRPDGQSVEWSCEKVESAPAVEASP